MQRLHESCRIHGGKEGWEGGGRGVGGEWEEDGRWGGEVGGGGEVVGGEGGGEEGSGRRGIRMNHGAFA